MNANANPNLESASDHPVELSGTNTNSSGLSVSILVLLFSVLITLVYNQRFWQIFLDNSSTSSFSDWLFISAAGFFLAFWFSFFFNFLAFRRTIKPAFIGALFIASLVNYFQTNYGTIINSSMIHNLLETDFHESSELITVPFLLYMSGYFLLPSLLLARIPLRWEKPLRHSIERVVLLLLCLIGLVTLFVSFNKDFSFLFRQNPELRSLLNPTYPIHSMIKTLRELNQEPVHMKPIGEEAAQTEAHKAHEHKTVVVMVVGETARAENFSLNGYERNTNPELAKQDAFNLSRMTSCGTSTAESLPCMFSHLSRKDYSRNEAKGYENLLDVVQHAGVGATWIDNQSGCKGICDRSESISTNALLVDPYCSDDGCRDEIMLAELRKQLQMIKSNDQDHLIVLHQEGSHGPAYYKRVPNEFRVFTPECRSINLQDCSREQVVNSYDNTILYTDHFLAQVIEILKAEDTELNLLMVYASDHGESLGENGLYLHGMPYLFAPDAQIHVLGLLWMSKGFETENTVDRLCLKKRAGEPSSHDNLFHTLLGALGIDTNVYQPEEDLFKACL